MGFEPNVFRFAGKCSPTALGVLYIHWIFLHLLFIKVSTFSIVVLFFYSFFINNTIFKQERNHLHTTYYKTISCKNCKQKMSTKRESQKAENHKITELNQQILITVYL